MARITTTSVGDGVTMRTERLLVLDGRDFDEAEIWRQFLTDTSERSNRPWGHHAQLIEGLRTRLRQLEARLPKDPDLRREHYKPRSTELWYVLEAVRRANLVEKYVSHRPWEAVSLACELGELVTELAFKMDLERVTLLGQRLLESQGQGARSRRRHPAEARHAAAARFIGRGEKVDVAFALAAEELGDKPGVIKRDYYHIKNGSNPTRLE